MRDTTTIFSASRQLQMQNAKVVPLPPAPASPLLPLEEALSIVQHHDAVAGTSKQHVAYDYVSEER